MQSKVKSLKKQLAVAATTCLLAAVSLTVATYAWFVSNSSVKGTSSTIAAKSNSFVLQIANAENGAQHGENQSLVASSTGHRISPSSTNDLKTWYACLGWGQDGKVHTYTKLSNIDADGKYTADTEHYAFLKSEYILYTISETGFCDVYLDGSDSLGAIQVSADGDSASDVIPDSMRIGITLQDMVGTTPSGDEKLAVVYAPKNETGLGNDATAIPGWTYVKDENSVAPVTYPHIFERSYSYADSSSRTYNYAATKVGDNYQAPSESASPIASNVDYDGVLMRVYIWLEGTDSDCINNSNQDDPSTYSVTISLAGVAK